MPQKHKPLTRTCLLESPASITYPIREHPDYTSAKTYQTANLRRMPNPPIVIAFASEHWQSGVYWVIIRINEQQGAY